MTQQEIKANLPQLPLRVDFIVEANINAVYSKDDMFIMAASTNSEIQSDAVTFASVHAINNTYGKGINPESVPDMFNALQQLVEAWNDVGMTDSASFVQDILNKATL